MAGRIELDELPQEVREQLGLTGHKNGRRRNGLTKDEVRSHAIRVLAAVASLPQRQRQRVLEHALKVNDV